MKNIHLIKTNKPSRLIIYSTLLNEFRLLDEPIENWKHKKNIYITSDEEIKEGDWYLVIGGIGLEVNTCHKSNGNTPINNCLKKIILTTDQDLDGVQAIDDEFLEWFVQNPSCEKVEVELFPKFSNKLYGIIIPKEEPKQIKCYCGHTIMCDCSPNEEPNDVVLGYKTSLDAQMLDKIEPKQETLEEAMNQNGYHESDYDKIWREGVEFGVKWQQERSYSEEDMRLAFETGRNFQLTGEDNFNELIEQFKKK